MGNDNNDKNKIRRKKVSSSSTKPTASSRKSTKNSSQKTKSISKSSKKDKFKIFRTVGVTLLVMLVLGVAVSTALVFVALKDVEPVTKAALDKKLTQLQNFYIVMDL